ncbi:hypothetical protein L1D26_23560 [Vibrio mediterranei]|uniref:hypothetical protein n=1 Tax=Vibrio mediterranei TaxID=689 RepID=UPI001EFEACE5|nr:hypothetical protein [Vibrio mediterranei]MCG9666032.1 hypothetical protein [Vibrio mediterranei]
MFMQSQRQTAAVSEMVSPKLPSVLIVFSIHYRAVIFEQRELGVREMSSNVRLRAPKARWYVVQWRLSGGCGMARAANNAGLPLQAALDQQAC